MPALLLFARRDFLYLTKFTADKYVFVKSYLGLVATFQQSLRVFLMLCINVFWLMGQQLVSSEP